MAALACYAHYRSSFVGLRLADAHDYAQMGRQLARGQGFSSLQTFPFELAWLEAHGASSAAPWPNAHRFPLLPLINAGVFRVAGASDGAAVVPGAAFFVGLAVVSFLLGNRLHGPIAGLAAAAFVVSSRTQLDYAIAGLTETGAAFFIVCAALLVSIVGGARRDPRPVASLLGVVIGLAFLLRSNLALLGVPAAALLLIGPERRGVAAVVWMAAGFSVTIAPWLIRNQAVFGSPLASAATERALLAGIVSGDAFYSFEQHDTWRLLAASPGLVASKAFAALPTEHWQWMFGVDNRWAGPLLLGAGLVVRTRRLVAAWAFALAVVAVTIGGVAVTYASLRYYLPLAPLVIVLASSGVVSAGRMVPARARSLVPVVVLAVCLVRMASAVASHGPVARTVSEIHAAMTAVAQHTPAGAVVASDLSWRTAWHGDRPSVRYSGGAVQLERLDADYGPVATVHLRPRSARRFRLAQTTGRLAAEFRELGTFPDGSTVWVRAGGRSVRGPHANRGGRAAPGAGR